MTSLAELNVFPRPHPFTPGLPGKITEQEERKIEEGLVEDCFVGQGKLIGERNLSCSVFSLQWIECMAEENLRDFVPNLFIPFPLCTVSMHTLNALALTPKGNFQALLVHQKTINGTLYEFVWSSINSLHRWGCWEITLFSWLKHFIHHVFCVVHSWLTFIQFLLEFLCIQG